MDWILSALARSGVVDLLKAALTLLMLAGCGSLPDDEAAWVLEDLAAEERPGRLKQRTPDPVRRPVAYAIQGRDYQGDLYFPGEPPLAGIVLVPGVAAREPAIREQVDFVLGVGGYYDLHQVITFFTTGYFRKEGQWHYLEPNRYGKWVFVLSNAERLSDPRDRSAFRAMAERRLNAPRAQINDLNRRLTPGGRALLALLENRDRVRTSALIDGLPTEIRADIEALNLANKDLARLRARLILLHGTDDAIIPYTESMALAAAVPPGRAELFLIDGLAHVDVRPRDLDRRVMWRAIHALLAQRNTSGE